MKIKLNEKIEVDIDDVLDVEAGVVEEGGQYLNIMTGSSRVSKYCLVVTTSLGKVYVEKPAATFRKELLNATMATIREQRERLEKLEREAREEPPRPDAAHAWRMTPEEERVGRLMQILHIMEQLHVPVRHRVQVFYVIVKQLGFEPEQLGMPATPEAMTATEDDAA